MSINPRQLPFTGRYTRTILLLLHLRLIIFPSGREGMFPFRSHLSYITMGPP